ncbi:hypothetical protein ACN9K5_11200, partial [Aliarcobacter butzleri]
CTISVATCGALFGQSDYDSDTTVKCLKEKELYLSVGYAFTESLSTSVFYVNVAADSYVPAYGEYDKWTATIEYTS